jgi:hypothetical protein
MLALAQAPERYLLLHSARGLLERDLEVVPQVGTATCATLAVATPAAEKLVEYPPAAPASAALAEHLAEYVEGVMETA